MATAKKQASAKSNKTAKPAAAADLSANHSFEVGKNYFIRTVTMYYTGRITRISDTDIVLEDAAWIADTGRFHNALKGGTLNEVEPFINPVIIPRGVVVDATIWDHELPRVQK
jgi:hypothetical protein